MVVQVSTKVLIVTIALLVALVYPTLHVHRQYRSGSDGKLKAAFVILVGPTFKGGENRTRGLQVALHALWHNYLQEHPQRVLLFVGDDVPEGQYTPEVVRAIAPAGMVAELVPAPYFAHPPDILRTTTLHSIMQSGKYPGYHNMCRWNFMGLMQHPKVRSLDYFCRIDTDSRIKSKIGYDLFEFMREKSLHYGYRIMSSENPNMTVGLWPFVGDYVNTHLRHAKDRLKGNHFHGNLTIGLKAEERWQMAKNEFECVHVRRFIEPDIVQFTEAIDATLGIYKHRWGDSPLRWMECMLFLNVANETKEFKFDYQQDHTSGWEEPREWGIRQVRAAK